MLLQCEARMKHHQFLPTLTDHYPSVQPDEVYSGSSCMPPGGGDMPRSCWPCATAFLFVVGLGIGTGRAVLPAFVLRFSDTLTTPDVSHQTSSAVLSVS